MKNRVTLALGFCIAAPVLAINMPPPVSVQNIDLIPASAVRIGQGINAAYRVTTTTGQASEIWIHTDCQSQNKTLLFINPLAGKGMRVYSTDSIDRYTPGSAFEPSTDSPFMAKPELNICNQSITEAKWVGLSSGEHNGDKQFVDVNNSSREGETVKARLATDFEKIHYEEKFGAPYSVIIRDVILSCNDVRGRVVSTFSLDSHGLMTDTSTSSHATFTALSPDMAGIAKTLCAAKDISHYAGKGTLTFREKAAEAPVPARPDLENNTPIPLQRFGLPAEVTSVINKTFSDSAFKPAFKTIRYTQSGPDSLGPGLMARIDAQPDGTVLSVVKMTIINSVFYSQYQRLFNLVDIKKWETMSEAPWVSKTLNNGITLPLLPGKTYSSHSIAENRDKPRNDKLLRDDCVAGNEWRNAADISPNLPGRYLEFICKNDLGDGKEASSDYAYLEALRIFIRIGYQSEGLHKRFTFTDVSVTR